MEATPEAGSVAARVTGTAPPCQPSSLAGANWAVVSGAVASFFTWTVPSPMLPALSVAR
ncbi:hypothetical protein [Nonomuraea sp. CA-141351]|uniref:hypothetical protein n=1 Tax=Nonomuraea sp. CA-141351 TaxID=3239996 RepID=UPI003D8CAB73